MQKLIHGDPDTFLDTGIVIIMILYIHVNWDVFHNFSKNWEE